MATAEREPIKNATGSARHSPSSPSRLCLPTSDGFSLIAAMRKCFQNGERASGPMITSATPPADSHLPWWRRPGIQMAILALAAYSFFLAQYVGTSAAGSDASGYMNHARLVAAGHWHATPRVLPGLAPK